MIIHPRFVDFAKIFQIPHLLNLLIILFLCFHHVANHKVEIFERLISLWFIPDFCNNLKISFSFFTDESFLADTFLPSDVLIFSLEQHN